MNNKTNTMLMRTLTVVLMLTCLFLMRQYVKKEREVREWKTQLDAVNRHMIERHRSEDSLNRVIDSLQILYGVEMD